MKQRIDNSVRFLRTTAIGGLLLLLPMAVVVALLGYVYQAVAAVHEKLRPWLPFDSMTSFVVLFAAAVVVLLTACFIAGLLARRAIGIRISAAIERQIVKFFPKYGIYKDLLASKIGGAENAPTLKPILVKRAGVLQFAFQTDRLANGLLIVYLPGAPDTWNGSLALVEPEQVQPINLPFVEVVELCEQLGRAGGARLSAALTTRE